MEEILLPYVIRFVMIIVTSEPIIFLVFPRWFSHLWMLSTSKFRQTTQMCLDLRKKWFVCPNSWQGRLLWALPGPLTPTRGGIMEALRTIPSSALASALTESQNHLWLCNNHPCLLGNGFCVYPRHVLCVEAALPGWLHLGVVHGRSLGLDEVIRLLILW